jgi:flagellar M-ring protein FliF
VYLEARQPAKASVVVRLRPGAQLVPQNVTAIQHLVASAVEGLAPESVSVLDVQGHLLSRPRTPPSADGAESGDRILEIRQSIERDLVAKISSTLEPLLGADKFRVGASVECDFTSGEQSDEIFDPNRSVMVSSQKSEDTSTTGGAAGIPGTASNLPRPAAKPGTALAGTSRRTESIAYQSSRTVRHTKLPEGTVKKMSLAVLLDQNVRWEGQGTKLHRVIEQPSAEKLKSIRDLVAAATGFSSERGDQLIVESLPFESTLNLEPPSATAVPKPTANTMNLPPWLAKYLDNRWILIGATLALGFVLSMARRLIGKMFGRKREATADMQPALPSAQEVLENQIEQQRRAQAELDAKVQAQLNAGTLSESAFRTEALLKRFRENINKDPALAAHVVRSWLNETS